MVTPNWVPLPPGAVTSVPAENRSARPALRRALAYFSMETWVNMSICVVTPNSTGSSW